MDSNNTGNSKIYSACDHITKCKPSFDVDEEVTKAIGFDYRTLPTFEKGLSNYIQKRHYSLQNNQFLKCRWVQYTRHIEERVFAPFSFPDVRDLHFKYARVQFLPELSIHRSADHRMKLKPGPGVDYYGQMPIPIELHMKRGSETVHEPKRKIKAQNFKRSHVPKKN